MDEINDWYKSEYGRLQAEHGLPDDARLPLDVSLALGDQFRGRVLAARTVLLDEMTAEQRAERVEQERARMEALAAVQRERAQQRTMGTPDDVQQALDQFSGHAPVLQDAGADPRIGKW